MAKITVSAWQPATVQVSDMGVDISLKRLTFDEARRLEHAWRRWMISYADRLGLVRLPGEEQARTADEKAFVISDAEIRERRVSEMSVETRARYEQLLAEDQAAEIALLTLALTDFVRVVPGQITAHVGDQEIDVTTGAQLLEFFGSRVDVLFRIVAALRARSLVSDDQKNGFGSPSTSRPSSRERDQTVTGDVPAPIAAPVSTMGSVTPAAATPIATTPSGATGS